MKRATILSRKKMIIAFSAVIVLAGVIAAGLLVWQQINKQKLASDEAVIEKRTSASASAFDAQQRAQSKAEQGDVDGALSSYDATIEATNDKVTKSSLYVGKSMIALNYGLPEVALEAAKNAVEAESTAGSLASLARAYERSGDKANAIIYYNKAADFIESDPNSVTSASSNSYRNRAKILERGE